LENKGNKSREDAWVNEENVIERKFDTSFKGVICLGVLGKANSFLICEADFSVPSGF
jgi:hypothetical protein